MADRGRTKQCTVDCVPEVGVEVNLGAAVLRARPEPSTELPRRRILVVDDNVDSARSMSLLLKRMWGQEVEVAHDGEGAIEKAGEFRPEVILLDIGLPGLSGFEVAKRLRDRPESGTTLLVAMTGWGQEDDLRRSRESGFDHHLVKPVDLDALRRLISSLPTSQSEAAPP